MKKLILTLTILTLCLAGFSQTHVWRGAARTVINLDLSTISGSDTTIYVTMPENYSPTWSHDTRWTNLTGAGTFDIVVSADATNWEAYNTTPTAAITGATGSWPFEDDRCSWMYLGFKITVGTISAGTLTTKITLR